MNDATAATPLSAARIRECLADTRLPSDPLAVVTPPEVGRWPEALRERLPRNLVPAGVLIPIIDRATGFTVLFTERSARLRYHAGQVSFPGGRMEAGDQDILATALRETHEEVGIEPGLIQVAGFLPPIPTVTGYAVTPVVGMLTSSVSIVPDPTEVERVFEVPLGFLLDPVNRQQAERRVAGLSVPIVEYRYGAEYIWGATASILSMLTTLLYKDS